MEYSDLAARVRQLGKVRKLRQQELAGKIIENLHNPPGKVILISGELNAGTYNNTEIGNALHQLLLRDKQSVTICWGPTTYFTLNGKRKNPSVKN